MKSIKIDVDNIRTIDDIKLVLKHMNLYFTPPEDGSGFDEIKHLLMFENENRVLVNGKLGQPFDKPLYLLKEEGEITKGDWAVYDTTLYLVDAYFLHTHKDKKNVTKVRKPDWL